MEEIVFRAAVVGDCHSTEMSPVRTAVARSLSSWDVREFRGLSELITDGPGDGFFPDLVLLCQRWRDEYSAREVRDALAAFPVARWICVFGAWCESEGRHGSRWPMAVRIPVGFVGTRLATEAAVVQGDIPALALTAARDEVFEFDTQQQPFPKHQAAEIPVAILSPDRELRSWLSDLCRQGGLVPEFQMESPDSPTIQIIDLDPFTQEMRDQIRRLKQQRPEARILGLLGLITPEVVREVQNEGVEAVLSKLTPAAQLLDRVLELAHPQ
jgi:hypothetical protein